jgi:hypothetical protein
MSTQLMRTAYRSRMRLPLFSCSRPTAPSKEIIHKKKINKLTLDLQAKKVSLVPNLLSSVIEKKLDEEKLHSLSYYY